MSLLCQAELQQMVWELEALGPSDPVGRFAKAGNAIELGL